MSGDTLPTLDKGHLEATTLLVRNGHDSHSPARVSASALSPWEWGRDSKASPSSGLEHVGK